MFLLMQQQMQELSRLIDQKIGDTHKAMNETQHNLNKTVQNQFGQSMKVFNEVTERLAKLDEQHKQVAGFAEQLEELQNVLKNPKQRGILGEYYLETLLKNVFPPGVYEMQYPFKDGIIVDAVIKVKDKIIPIDSKFSLENYNRIIEERDPLEKERLEKVFKQDLKNRIDETSKYVRPEEGTLDFAFMFIPAEGIYYDLLVNQVGGIKINTRDLIEYAFIEKKVHIVSPTTFLAHLKMVLQGLRAMQMEESTKEIIKRVEELRKHLMSYEEYMKKLGTSMSATVGHYNNAYKEFNKIDKDIVRIAGTEKFAEPIQMEKPVLIED